MNYSWVFMGHNIVNHNATSYLKQPTFRSESRHAQANNLAPTTVRTELSQALNNSKRCRLTSYWEMQPRVAACSCSAGRHHVGSRHPWASLPRHTPEQLRAASLESGMQDSSYLQLAVCSRNKQEQKRKGQGKK